jgi:hypothetical protein
MERLEPEIRWSKLVTQYQRRRSVEAMRALVREMEPPRPHELIVDPETALSWRTLGPPPLDGLDHFVDKLDKLISPPRPDSPSRAPSCWPEAPRAARKGQPIYCMSDITLGRSSLVRKMRAVYPCVEQNS